MNKFADFLEREGGHVALLAVYGAVFLTVACIAPKDSDGCTLAKEGFGACFGALTYAMKGGLKQSSNPTTQPQSTETKQ